MNNPSFPLDITAFTIDGHPLIFLSRMDIRYTRVTDLKELTSFVRENRKNDDFKLVMEIYKQALLDRRLKTDTKIRWDHWGRSIPPGATYTFMDLVLTKWSHFLLFMLMASGRPFQWNKPHFSVNSKDAFFYYQGPDLNHPYKRMRELLYDYELDKANFIGQTRKIVKFPDYDPIGVRLLIYVVLLCDGYYTLEEGTPHTKTKRFFSCVQRLPFEVQNQICHPERWVTAETINNVLKLMVTDCEFDRVLY